MTTWSLAFGIFGMSIGTLVWIAFGIKKHPALTNRWVFLSIIAGSQGLGWVFMSTYLMLSGSFSHIALGYPRLLVLGIIPAFITTILLLKTPFMTALAYTVSTRWALILATLKLPVEVVLIQHAAKGNYPLILTGDGLGIEIVVGMLLSVFLILNWTKLNTNTPIESRLFYYVNRCGQISVLWTVLIWLIVPKVFPSVDLSSTTRIPNGYLFTLYYPLTYLLHTLLLKKSMHLKQKNGE